MSTTQDDPVAQLERLRAEAAEHRLRVGQLATVDAKRELSAELWPWMENLCDVLKNILDEQGDVLDELINGGESAIEFALAAKILGVFEVGKQLAAAAEQVLPLIRLDTQRNALAALIANFRAAADAIGPEVADATIEAEGDLGEAVADFDDDDGEDEDEAAGGAQ